MTKAPSEREVEQALDRLAATQKPGDLGKLDRQFADKLARVAAEKGVPQMLVDQLRLLWDMLKAPDAVVPWSGKALIMAALTYFASPLDLLPDWVSRLGYLDDTLVVAIVHRRLRAEIAAFQNQRR